MNQKNHIESAMFYLANMPSGGIGPEGPTLGELEKNMVEYSREDASWYNAQLAWRHLEKALEDAT